MASGLGMSIAHLVEAVEVQERAPEVLGEPWQQVADDLVTCTATEGSIRGWRKGGYGAPSSEREGQENSVASWET